MKKQKFSKKITLSKETIARLDNKEMSQLEGGDLQLITFQIICRPTLQKTCFYTKITCACPQYP